jgi:hypothetical protein
MPDARRYLELLCASYACGEFSLHRHLWRLAQGGCLLFLAVFAQVVSSEAIVRVSAETVPASFSLTHRIIWSTALAIFSVPTATLLHPSIACYKA